MGYFGQAVTGISWVSAFRASTRGIAFVRTIILARILTPNQFGVFGIVSLTITFLEILMETGVNVVLIQKKEGMDEYLDTAWVVSIIRGILISTTLILLAPVIASFFNSPDSKNLIYLVSLVPLTRGFINPGIVRFQKDLRFRTEFWFRFIVFAFDSLIAIFVSVLTQSAIGLVWGLLAGAMLELVMSYIFVKPRPHFGFQPEKLKEILSKGKWITGAGVFQFLFRQGDDGVVGKMLGEGSLGIYQIAYKICSLPISEVTDVFGRVTFPLYVKLSADIPRLKAAFLKTTLTITLLALLVGSILFIFGGEIIRIFLGEKWLAAVPLVKILSIFGIIQAIGNSMNSLFLALEKQEYVTLVTFIGVLGLGISIVPLTLNYGLNGAVWAPLAGSLVAAPLSVGLVIRVLRK